LLTSEPLKTAQTTGSSRSARTPVTCSALSARSSPRTPAVFFAATFERTATSSATAVAFFAATLVRIATSSRTVAMSSRRARKPEAAMDAGC
jgi:hypothetical protein